MLNGRLMVVDLMTGFIKKTESNKSVKMSQYFPKPYESFGGDINVTVDWSNYATKSDMNSISYVNTSSFALKFNLASLKTEVYKLDIDKLVPLPIDLSKLRDVVKNDAVEKAL